MFCILFLFEYYLTWQLSSIYNIFLTASFLPISFSLEFNLYDGSLLLEDVRKKHSGNYTCTATNEHGSASVTHSLVVLGKILSVIS